MNMKDLNVFITVAEEENLTKASKLLYMTPQGVSKIIKNLESENDCELFLLLRVTRPYMMYWSWNLSL